LCVFPCAALQSSFVHGSSSYYPHFFTVKQQTSVIIERFGKFQRKRIWITTKIPLIDRVAGRVNLKIQQLDVIIETKTKDNVFVKLKVSVQFMVIKDTVYDAFYKLNMRTIKLPLMF
jgi:regulator of protease activity HflC (stomatin/prohibitin superfamily)